MASVKVLLREEHIYIRVIENRKPKFKSLKIKIQKKFWNKSKQRVSPNYPDSEKINFIIEKKLKELEYLENNLNLVNENTKSILKYWDILIDNTTNRGSKEKHKNGKNTFFKYIQSIGKSDFLFMELQPHDVHAYFKYMRENGISNDTANYRIKAFKALINRAIEDKTIRYFDDPFATTKAGQTDHLRPVQIDHIGVAVFFKEISHVMKWLQIYLFNLKFQFLFV